MLLSGGELVGTFVRSRLFHSTGLGLAGLNRSGFGKQVI